MKRSQRAIHIADILTQRFSPIHVVNPIHVVAHVTQGIEEKFGTYRGANCTRTPELHKFMGTSYPALDEAITPRTILQLDA